MTNTGTLEPAARTSRPPGWLVACWALLALAAVLGAAVLALLLGWVLPAGIAVLALVALVAYRPFAGTCLYFATLPLIAGIDRDTLFPYVRPNEALLVVVVAGAVLGGWYRLVRGARPAPVLTRVDLALAGFALFATVWPVASLLLRSQWPTPLEMSSLLPVVKLAALYLLVRCTVPTRRDAVVLTRVLVWSTAAVAVLATLQTLRFGPVISLLQGLYLPEDTTAADAGDRGSATLGSPIATGDVIVIALVLLAWCYHRRLFGIAESLVLGGVLGVGVLAAGQFSSWIAAAIAFGLLLWRLPGRRVLALRAVPLVVLAAVAGAPAVLRRVSEFGTAGLPESWQGRWDNLSNFFLPHFDLTHVLLGVSPNPVLDAPETWRSVIYLESGYLYLLWIGGLPLLAAFGWVSVEILRHARRTRLLHDTRGVFGSTVEIVWWILLVLTILDPHLTLRGTGDVIAALLAMMIGQARERQQT